MRTVRIAIQLFWALAGLLGAMTLIAVLCLLAGKWPYAPGHSLFDKLCLASFLVAIILSSGAIVFIAYRALFRFSPSIIGPTMGLVLLWSGLKVWYRIDVAFSQATGHTLQTGYHFIYCLFLLGIVLPLVFSAPGTRLYGLIERVMIKPLFPGPRDSATQFS
jgi:hypothetical protein